ncbi:glycosyltransferase family 4 protein [Candidatus Kaiserbacteria bacterium]|nr:glycosyltransferase family 4 protein [Candidatus Kaiserbacteria bacterium]
MKLLSISTDRKIFEEESAVRARMTTYGACFEELHVIVFAKKRLGFEKTQIAENVWAYPTNSSSRWLYIWDAIRLARDIESDVITTQDPFETGYVGMKVSKEKHIPLHVQVHTDFFSAGFQKHSFLNRIRLVIAERVIRRADRIRVVSEHIRNRITRHFKPKAEISILPIFVNIERYRDLAKVSHEKFELLFVGRLESEKRPYWALAALEHLREKGVDAHLTFVGGGALMKGLKRQAGEHVTFIGYDDPLPHYAKADMVLVPSLYEGYGMVMVEASMTQIPVVATDVGVAKEIGVHIAPHDIEGFSETVWQCYSEKCPPASFTYFYESEADYVEKWCDDIKKTL